MTVPVKAAIVALAALFALVLAMFVVPGESAAQAPAAPPALQGPANTLGGESDADIWRRIRMGEGGLVTLPNPRAGILIQSEGDNWRALRNGPVAVYGAWAMGGMLVVLALFFALRGRIRIDSGRSGRYILRFTLVERLAHWLTAASFIVLAMTGLNILYGKYWLMPIVGKPAFAAITQTGKVIHNWGAWVFVLGLLMILALWVRDNLPDRYDWNWIRQGGGLFAKGRHPPAGKFNFGQKMIFWAVILGGAAVSLSGFNLLFPFTFTDLQGLQMAQLAHSITALALTAIILAHIYIGTVGMEGAIDAMTTGMVDENWAKEHHSAWVEQTQGRGEGKGPTGQPAPHGQPAE